MGRHREWWEGIRGYRKAYGAMGRVRERWGGLRGHGRGQGALGRHTGP